MQRDEEDIVQSMTNYQPEFEEYYLQMYVAKGSQAPQCSQVKNDLVTSDKTVSVQVSIWKSSRGLSDKVVTDHICSGDICSYFQIGNVFVYEKTGNVHVCDDTCKEFIADLENMPKQKLIRCAKYGVDILLINVYSFLSFRRYFCLFFSLCLIVLSFRKYLFACHYVFGLFYQYKDISFWIISTFIYIFVMYLLICYYIIWILRGKKKA